MRDWVSKLNGFLQFNEYKVLQNAEKISHQIAKKLAEDEYEKFRIKQDLEYISDFDKLTQELFEAKGEKDEDSE